MTDRWIPTLQDPWCTTRLHPRTLMHGMQLIIWSLSSTAPCLTRSGYAWWKNLWIHGENGRIVYRSIYRESILKNHVSRTHTFPRSHSRRNGFLRSPPLIARWPFRRWTSASYTMGLNRVSESSRLITGTMHQSSSCSTRMLTAKLYDGENNSVFSFLTPHQTGGTISTALMYGLWIYCRPDYDVHCSDHATNLNIGFDIASLRVSSVKDVSPDVAWALGILVWQPFFGEDHPVSASLRDIVKHKNHDCYVWSDDV
jgi:hypothetical protein